MERKFSTVLSKEDNWFVSYCPELGVASQGKTRKSAIKNLKEAVELYLECDPIGLPERI
jgi:predicted RNase H-like HicB family nuclease